MVSSAAPMSLPGNWQQSMMNNFQQRQMEAQLMAQLMAARESALPSFLQLTPNTGMDAQNAAMAQFLRNNKGGVAQSRSNEQAFGGPGNGFATARTAQMKAALQANAQTAGQNARNEELNRIMAQRAAYMGGPQVSLMPTSQPMQQAGGADSAEPSGFARAMSIGKGVDNFLGGALSNSLGQFGSGLGNVLGAGLNAINPFAKFATPGASWGGSGGGFYSNSANPFAQNPPW